MGARHLQQLADLPTEPDATLKPYVFELAEALGTSMDGVHTHLRQMLHRHSEEWAGFVASQGASSFLNIWTRGGRHG
jgi:hypothetical protein